MKRLLAAIAVSLLAIFGYAAPAQAAIYECPDQGYICFYNYGSFIRTGTYPGIYVADMFPPSYGTCRNLPTSGVSGWPNGGDVYNNASSLIVNNSGSNNLAGTQETFFYDGANCPSSETPFEVLTHAVTSPTYVTISQLSDFGWGNRIGSYKILHTTP